jgi:subtilase family serine protease
VTSISTPTSVEQGANFDFSYLVKNAGGVAAGYHYAGINLDQPVTDTNAIAWNIVNSLGANASQTFNNSVSTANLSVGQHTLYIMEDYYVMVGESNEVNNARSFDFLVI